MPSPKLILLGILTLTLSGALPLLVAACVPSRNEIRTAAKDQALTAGLEAARLAIAIVDARSGELTPNERETLGRAKRALAAADQALELAEREQCQASIGDAVRALSALVSALPNLPPELAAALALASEVSK